MRQECLNFFIMKLNQYMICINNVTIQNIGNAMYKPSIYIWIIVYTCLSHVYTEIQISVLVYAIRKHVQNMLVPCLYLDIPTQTSSYMLQTAQSTLSTCFACNQKNYNYRTQTKHIVHISSALTIPPPAFMLAFNIYSKCMHFVALLVLNPPPPPALPWRHRPVHQDW